MPIEIKELHIRVALNASPAPSGPKPGHEEGKDALVAECVEQVLAILKNKTER